MWEESIELGVAAVDMKVWFVSDRSMGGVLKSEWRGVSSGRAWRSAHLFGMKGSSLVGRAGGTA